MLATSAYEVVLAVHIMAVVIAFGWTFALPIVYMVAARRDPRSLPVLHRIECRIQQILVNPALVVVLGAGIFMAGDGHHWSEFFVQWGLGAVIVMGGLVGSVMIPAAKRAEEAAGRDLQDYEGGELVTGEEYRAIVRRLNFVGSSLALLVLVTILFMVVKP
jgi:uncharacterized membrane protein